MKAVWILLHLPGRDRQSVQSLRQMPTQSLGVSHSPQACTRSVTLSPIRVTQPLSPQMMSELIRGCRHPALPPLPLQGAFSFACALNSSFSHVLTCLFTAHLLLGEEVW